MIIDQGIFFSNREENFYFQDKEVNKGKIVEKICFGNQIFKKEVLLGLKELFKQKIITREEIVLGIIIYTKIIETERNLNLVFSKEAREDVLKNYKIKVEDFDNVVIDILVATKNLHESSFFNRYIKYDSNYKTFYDYLYLKKLFLHKTEEEVLNHLGYIPDNLNIWKEYILTQCFVVENYTIYKKNEMSSEDFFYCLEKIKNQLSEILPYTIHPQNISILFNVSNLKFSTKTEVLFLNDEKGKSIAYNLKDTNTVGNFFLNSRPGADFASLFILTGPSVPVLTNPFITNSIFSLKDPAKHLIHFLEDSDIIKLKEEVFIFFN